VRGKKPGGGVENWALPSFQVEERARGFFGDHRTPGLLDCQGDSQGEGTKTAKLSKAHTMKIERPHSGGHEERPELESGLVRRC